MGIYKRLTDFFKKTDISEPMDENKVDENKVDEIVDRESITYHSTFTDPEEVEEQFKIFFDGNFRTTLVNLDDGTSRLTPPLENDYWGQEMVEEEIEEIAQPEEYAPFKNIPEVDLKIMHGLLRQLKSSFVFHNLYSEAADLRSLEHLMIPVLDHYKKIHDIDDEMVKQLKQIPKDNG